jgi:hypothetical protein
LVVMVIRERLRGFVQPAAGGAGELVAQLEPREPPAVLKADDPGGSAAGERVDNQVAGVA